MSCFYLVYTYNAIIVFFLILLLPYTVEMAFTYGWPFANAREAIIFQSCSLFLPLFIFWSHTLRGPKTNLVQTFTHDRV